MSGPHISFLADSVDHMTYPIALDRSGVLQHQLTTVVGAKELASGAENHRHHTHAHLVDQACRESLAAPPNLQ